MNNLVDRNISLSDNQFHHDNINLIKQTLNNNNHPMKLLYKKISKRRAILHHKAFPHEFISTQDNIEIHLINNIKEFIKLPYL